MESRTLTISGMTRRETTVEGRPRVIDRRMAVLNAATAVLKSLGGTAVPEALEMRKAIEAGVEPARRHFLIVETALLVALMSPKLEDERPVEKGFLATASGAFRKFAMPMPTRQHARRVYKEFEYGFSKKPARSSSIQ
jgi:hypothetical protein